MLSCCKKKHAIRAINSDGCNHCDNIVNDNKSYLYFRCYLVVSEDVMSKNVVL